MKKCVFFRTVYKKEVGRGVAVRAEGYCESFTDKNGNEIVLCFFKLSKSIWAVIEKSTGLLVCYSDKRMNALEEAKKHINIIYGKIQNAEKYKSIIAAAYAEI